MEHLDLAHHLFTLTLSSKLHLAPLPPSPSVLDLGTGTGIWAIDFADSNPSCSVIGTDLSPIQPTWHPPNCEFQIDDFNDPWTFGANRFDFIHLRTSHGCVHSRAALYAQCLTALKPGGYLEEVEYAPEFISQDNSIAPGSPLAQWTDVALACAARLPDEEIYVFRHMATRIRAAGFEDVTEESFYWPLGPWAKGKELKELGAWGRMHIDLGAENWVLRLLTSMGWEVKDIKKLCDGVRKQMREKGVHALHQMNVVYARKPMV
jgi:SAM-dependent methyltransferase